MDSASVTYGCGGADFAAGREPQHLVGAAADRCDAPVVREPDGSWLVTGYQQARDFLRDDRFSRARLSASVHPRGPALRMSITELDRPTHTRVRNLIGGAFSARAVDRLRPRIECRAHRFLSDATAAGPDADLLADFGAPFTFDVQCEILGVPDRFRPVLRQCSMNRLGRPGSTTWDTYRAELRLYEEVRALIEKDDLVPGGLLAELVAAHRARPVLTDEDLNGLAASLFFDGHALTAAQLVNAVCYLLTTRDLYAAVRNDRGLLDGVVEESLRMTPAAPRSMARIASTDVVLGGERVCAGERVTALLPLANRDHDEFSVPDQCDPDRSGSKHLSFGYATHHCIGAHLARVEVRAGLDALLTRVPNLRLAVPEQHLTWYVTPNIRSLTALPVRWSTR